MPALPCPATSRRASLSLAVSSHSLRSLSTCERLPEPSPRRRQGQQRARSSPPEIVELARVQFGISYRAVYAPVDASGLWKLTGRKLFTQPKINVRECMPTLAYRIVSATAGIDERTGLPITTSKIIWESEVNITADEAVAVMHAAMRSGRERSNAVAFLSAILANGPVLKSLIDQQAAAWNLSKDQLDRAKTKIGVMSFKTEFSGGGWSWCLPQHHPNAKKE